MIVLIWVLDRIIRLLGWLDHELHGPQDYRREGRRWRRVDGPDR